MHESQEYYLSNLIITASIESKMSVTRKITNQFRKILSEYVKIYLSKKYSENINIVQRIDCRREEKCIYGKIWPLIRVFLTENNTMVIVHITNKKKAANINNDEMCGWLDGSNCVYNKNIAMRDTIPIVQISKKKRYFCIILFRNRWPLYWSHITGG